MKYTVVVNQSDTGRSDARTFRFFPIACDYFDAAIHSRACAEADVFLYAYPQGMTRHTPGQDEEWELYETETVGQDFLLRKARITPRPQGGVIIMQEAING